MTPSAKTLSERLGLGEDAAAELKAALVRWDWSEERTRRGADAVLELADRLMDGDGVEAISADNRWREYHMDIVLLYVNTGETYTDTLRYDTERGTFSVGSWGAWVEHAEAHRGMRFS